jgi:hypothetical protein
MVPEILGGRYFEAEKLSKFWATIKIPTIQMKIHGVIE